MPQACLCACAVRMVGGVHGVTARILSHRGACSAQPGLSHQPRLVPKGPLPPWRRHGTQQAYSDAADHAHSKRVAEHPVVGPCLSCAVSETSVATVWPAMPPFPWWSASGSCASANARHCCNGSAPHMEPSPHNMPPPRPTELPTSATKITCGKGNAMCMQRRAERIAPTCGAT